MDKKKLFKEIGNIDEDLIREADVEKKRKGLKKPWVKGAAMAACIAILALIGTYLYYGNKGIDLKLSTGNVKVSYTKMAPNIASSADLVYLTEEEIFTKYNTVIFKGTIEEINNIVIDMNGRKDYEAIAKIKVNSIYRGELKEGQVISVILPCPIGVDNLWIEDTGIASAMRPGMEGIFMPVVYNEEDYREENGARLYYKDFVDYGLLDGERWAFLEGKDNLIFARFAYESIANASNLQEIEEYVKTMIH